MRPWSPWRIIGDLAPIGPPIVAVMSAEDLTVPHARTLAAVSGAGRQTLLLVSEGELEDAVQQWLGQGIEVAHLSRDDEVLSHASTHRAPQDETTPRPELPPSGGDYCPITWAGVSVAASR